MANCLFKFNRSLCLAATLLGAGLLPVQAGSFSPEPASPQIQKPIILAQAKHDDKAEKKSKAAAKKTAVKKNTAAKKKINPWSVQCGSDEKSGKKFCRMQQIRRSKSSGQRTLAVIIQPQEIEPKLAILLILPLGLYLPAGTGFKIDDGEENRLVIETCDAEGCYASGGLTKKHVAALKKGKRMLVAVLANNKKPLTIPVTLAGFSAAFEKITKSN